MPDINVERVKNRILRGGHSLPEAKIRERWLRTMQNLSRAVRVADRVYFFDNSQFEESESYQYFAEKREGQLSGPAYEIPDWFSEYILKTAGGSPST